MDIFNCTDTDIKFNNKGKVLILPAKELTFNINEDHFSKNILLSTFGHRISVIEQDLKDEIIIERANTDLAIANTLELNLGTATPSLNSLTIKIFAKDNDEVKEDLDKNMSKEERTLINKQARELGIKSPHVMGIDKLIAKIEEAKKNGLV